MVVDCDDGVCGCIDLRRYVLCMVLWCAWLSERKVDIFFECMCTDMCVCVCLLDVDLHVCWV